MLVGDSSWTKICVSDLCKLPMKIMKHEYKVKHINGEIYSCVLYEENIAAQPHPPYTVSIANDTEQMGIRCIV